MFNLDLLYALCLCLERGLRFDCLFGAAVLLG